VSNLTQVEVHPLALAKASIIPGYNHGAHLIPPPSLLSHLTQRAFVFVSVEHQGVILGCQGVENGEIGVAICQAAWRAAFGDLRDGSISLNRMIKCDISVHLLTVCDEMMDKSTQVASKIHRSNSVSVKWGGLKATMLNTVQSTCVNNNDFLAQTMKKAKITMDHSHLEWTIYNTSNLGPVQWNLIELPDCLLI